MSIPISTLDDLLAALKAHPEWRERLLEVLLGEKFLQLPDRVTRVEDALILLTEEVRENARQILALTERMDSLTERVDKLAELMRLLTEQVQELTSVTKQMRDDISGLKGSEREQYYRNNASAILGRYMTATHVVDKGKLLDELHTAQPLSDQEWDQMVALDLLVDGKIRGTDRRLMLAIEVSWVIDRSDVERAMERAAILAGRNLPAIPAVAGKGILPDARDLSSDKDVVLLLDGAVLNKHQLA